MSARFNLIVSKGTSLDWRGMSLVEEYTENKSIRTKAGLTAFDEWVGRRCDLQTAQQIHFRFAAYGIPLYMECGDNCVASYDLWRSGCPHWKPPNVRINEAAGPVKIPTSISYRYHCRECRSCDMAVMYFGSTEGHYCRSCGLRDFELVE